VSKRFPKNRMVLLHALPPLLYALSDNRVLLVVLSRGRSQYPEALANQRLLRLPLDVKVLSSLLLQQAASVRSLRPHCAARL
jgi:hypothetical protein